MALLVVHCPTIKHYRLSYAVFPLRQEVVSQVIERALHARLFQFTEVMITCSVWNSEPVGKERPK